MSLSLKNDYMHNDDDTTTIFIKSKKYGTVEMVLLTEDLIKIDKWASQPHINATEQWGITTGKANKGHALYAKIGILSPKGGWVACGGNGGRCRRRTVVMVHRLIMEPDDGMVVDHIDGNGLNNLRENLRVCTNAENSRNTRQYAKTASRFKGVSKADSKSNPWKARLKYNYKEVYIGTFKTQEEAARAYDEKAKELFGEYANLNFLDE